MRRTCLALALVTAPLLACPGDDQGETAASTGNVTTGVSTSTPADTGDSGGTSTGPSGTSMATGSSGPPADGDGSSTTAAGTSPLDACLATCNHLMKCGIEEVPNCGIPCAGAPSTAAGCSEEYVAQQECAAALSCEDLQLWVDAMVQPGEHPCEAEDEAYQVCETGVTSG